MYRRLFNLILGTTCPGWYEKEVSVCMYVWFWVGEVGCNWNFGNLHPKDLIKGLHALYIGWESSTSNFLN